MLTAGIFLLPNGTFFVELAVFLVLIWLHHEVRPPAAEQAMERRQEHIRTALEAADAARADAAAADDERRHALEEARQQAREIVAAANRTAETVRSEAQARGQAEYDRIVAPPTREVALARQRAVEEAASRMGEHRDGHGRAGDRPRGRRRVAPRPHRRGRGRPHRRRAGAPRPGRAREPEPAPATPRPSSARCPRRTGGRVAADVRSRSTTWSRPTRELYTALTDTAVPAAARRGAGRRPAGRPGVGPGPPGRGVRRRRGHRRPRCRPRWAG